MGLKKFFVSTIFLLFVGIYAGISAKHAPINSDSLMLQARDFERRLNFDSALVIYKQIETNVHGYQLAQVKLKLANIFRELKDYEAAHQQLTEFRSLRSFATNQDSVMEAEFLFVEGKMKADEGDYVAAIPKFDSATIYLNNTDTSQFELLSRIHNYHGIVNHFLGDFDAALISYRKAANFHRSNRTENMDFADILQNLAIIHTVKGSFDSASYFIQKSKKIRERYITADDQQMASFYVNYGRFLLMLGNQSESLKLYQKAEELFRAKGAQNEEYLGPVLINIGNSFQIRGDYEKAAAYYKNAIHLLKRVFDSDHPYLITVENNLAFVYNQLGQFQASLELSKKNETINIPVISKIRLYRNMAKALQGINKNIEARYYFNSAINLAQEKLGTDHFEYGAALMDYGDFLFLEGDYNLSLKQYEKVYEVYHKLFQPEDSEIAILYRRIGTGYLQLGQFEIAEGYFNNTEKLLTNHRLSTDDHRKMLLTDLYFDKGKLYHKWFLSVGNEMYLKQSFDNFTKGILLLDDFSQAISDESRMTLGENLRSGFDAAMEVAFKLYDQTSDQKYAAAAFEIAGKSKSVVLLSSVRKNQALFSAGVPDEVVELERSIKQDIVSLSKLTSEERQKAISNDMKIAFFEEQRLNLIQKYDSLLKKIESKFPDYYALRYDMSVVSIEQVQKKLRSDEVLIEYMMTDHNCFIIASSKEEIRMVHQLHADSILQAITELRQQSLLNFTANGKAHFNRYIDLTSRLYHWLLAPVAEMLTNKRLIIVPDGILGYLPFEVLINPSKLQDSTAKNYYYQDLPYILYDHPISYAYSSTLRYTGISRKKSNYSGLNAYVPDYSTGFHHETDSMNKFRMQPLVYAREEVNNVLNAWKNGKMFYASEASKRNFIQTSPKAHILHLAMHAIIDDNNPLYSRLIFQQDSASPESFELNTYELYSLRLNASLAVLSACNTGAGLLQYGEGVISLSRGFIYAGVPSILMTGWEVDDRAGALLMEAFYKYLNRGLPKDVALQKARIDYLQDVNMLKAHPFFWGAYMLIGDNQPVDQPFNYKYLLYFVIPILLLGFVILAKYRKKVVAIIKST